MSKHMLGYIRVSTEEQQRSGLGVEAQEAAIAAEAQRRGWTYELAYDLGCSGKHVNPELRRGLDMLDAGQFDGLMVAKLDRLARSVRHASAIIDSAITQGWALVVLDNALDLTTPGGRAMANMLATFAELERDLIATRTREALAARKARGLHNGRRTAIPPGCAAAHRAGTRAGGHVRAHCRRPYGRRGAVAYRPAPVARVHRAPRAQVGHPRHGLGPGKLAAEENAR